MILNKRTPLAQDSRVAGTHGMEEILFIQISTVLALSVYMWYTGASRNLPANMRSAHIDGKKIDVLWVHPFLFKKPMTLIYTSWLGMLIFVYIVSPRLLTEVVDEKNEVRKQCLSCYL